MHLQRKRVGVVERKADLREVFGKRPRVTGDGNDYCNSRQGIRFNSRPRVAGSGWRRRGNQALKSQKKATDTTNK